MKNLAYTIIAFVALVGMSSCSETDDSNHEFSNWEQRNKEYFDNIYAAAQSNTSRYKIYRKWSLEESKATSASDHIVVEPIVNGTGSGCPLFTDSVKVHYEGRLIPSETYTGGYVFDKSWSGEYNLETMTPSTFAVSGVIDGFTTALMKMHIGDRWRVYIPQELGYGSTAQSSGGIPAYSTLIFDITLVAYGRVGTVIPTPQAKPMATWFDE